MNAPRSTHHGVQPVAEAAISGSHSSLDSRCSLTRVKQIGLSPYRRQKSPDQLHPRRLSVINGPTLNGNGIRVYERFVRVINLLIIAIEPVK